VNYVVPADLHGGIFGQRDKGADRRSGSTFADAEVVETFPALSVTLIWTVCTPSRSVGAVVCQALPSMEYWVKATPEVASDAVAERTAGETYQLLAPSGTAGLTDRLLEP
jgi:hypothetical protein